MISDPFKVPVVLEIDTSKMSPIEVVRIVLTDTGLAWLSIRRCA